MFTPITENWHTLNNAYFVPQGHLSVVREMCNTGGMTQTQWAAHCNSEQHRQKVAQIRCRRDGLLRNEHVGRRIDDVQQLEKRAKRLRYSPPWRDDIDRALYEALMKSSDPSILQRAGATVRRYEHMERVSLLEVAIRKYACLDDTVKPIRDIVAISQWLKDGWKVNKSKTRGCRAISIIVTHVVPF